MAALKKLRHDRYQLDFVLFGHRIRTNFLNEHHAREFLESLFTVFPREKASLGKAVETYLASETDKRKSRQTRQMERYWFYELKTFLKTHGIQNANPVALITRFHLEQFQLSLKQNGSSRGRKLSNSSVNRRFTVFKHFFSRLREWEFIRKDPCEYIRKLPEVMNRRSKWNTADIEKVLSAGTLTELELDVFKFLLGTGMRLGSLADVRARDVQLGERVIFVRQKKGRGEETGFYIPLAESLVSLVEKRLPANSDEHLFNRGDGLRLKTASISKGISRRLAWLGLKHLTVHGLRHTFASRLAEQGASTEIVRLLLGHASGKTTERYIHLQLSDLRKWLD